jgi:hypothetical protein
VSPRLLELLGGLRGLLSRDNPCRFAGEVDPRRALHVEFEHNA